VYSPSIGFTQAIGESAKQLVGLSGIFIGIGEVFGGVSFGLMGSRITTKIGRDPIVILGFIVHLIAFFLIFLNIPNNANFGDTTDIGECLAATFIDPSTAHALLFPFHSLFGSAATLACSALLFPPRLRRFLFQHANLLDARRCFQKALDRGILDFQIHTSECLSPSRARFFGVAFTRIH
jgi:hypothetical protein